jgi:hypothetical protein
MGKDFKAVAEEATIGATKAPLNGLPILALLVPRLNVSAS